MDYEVDFMMHKDECLNVNSYPLWSFRLKQAFSDKKIWFFMRDDNPPTIATHNLLELGRGPSEVEIQTTRLKALFMLSKSVEDRILARFSRLEDPAELWTQLHNCYASNTNTRWSVLKRHLMGFRFSESQSMT